jgi:hypothetical protein
MLSDYSQYYLNITGATQSSPPKIRRLFKSVREFLGLPTLSNDAVRDLSQRLLTSNTTYQNYLNMYDSNFILPTPLVSNSIDPSGYCVSEGCRILQSCSMTSWFQNEYSSCLEQRST